MTGPVWTALLIASGGVTATASSQESLARAADEVRQAWRAHDAQAIVGPNPRVVA